jgi:hypothetical protein
MPGFILYQGPSMLDGAPIVAIAITSSTNKKTGDMVQTYVMRADVNPLEALATGQDHAVCGDCKHRPILGGACYVNVGQGANAVYKAFVRGIYPEDAKGARMAAAGCMVRLGTYGDPMAVPAAVWTSLVLDAAGHTGYTHQWLNDSVDAGQREAISTLCMASADTPAEGEMARSIGLRTFRMVRPGDAVARGEFVCPASEEAGKKKTCAECGACDGSARGRAASPVIIAHGAKASRFIRIGVSSTT